MKNYMFRGASSWQGFLFAAVIVTFLFCGSVARAQNTADVVGTITDSSNAAVPGAKITITNTGTGVSRSMQASATGDYAFSLLPVGVYSISVEASGFKTYQAPSVNLAAGDRARVDAKMEVGTVNQTITVEAAAAPLLQTDSSTVGGLITNTAVQDLPTNGRNVVKLVQLAPGASEGPQSSLSGGTRPDDRRQTSTIVANGQNNSSNNFLLDGMDDNERAIGTVIVKPSIDSLEEVKVDTNLYGADVGRNAGAVITMITKSGSNSFRGSAFEFLRNDIFDAKDAFNVPRAGNPLAGRKPEYRQNQFGGSLGGPIIKNKTFFFADYEGLRIVQGLTQTAFTPTPCELGFAACNGVKQLGNFSDVSTPIYNPTTHTQFPGNIIPSGSINSISANYAQLYPDVVGCTSGPCSFVSNNSKTQYFHTADARIDHRFSDSDNVFGRYTINSGTSEFPGVFPAVSGIGAANYPVFGNGIVPIGGAFPGSNYSRQQNLTIGWSHIFRPNLLLDAHVSVSRYVSISTANNAGHNVNNDFGGPANVNLPFLPGTDGLALINFQTGGYSAVGDQFALPTDYWDTNYQYAAALTWTKGAHTLKFGGSVLRRTWMTYQQLFKGEFSFSSFQTSSNGTSTGTGGNSLASFLLGTPNGDTVRLSLTRPLDRDWEVGSYVQDDWRTTHWLTLNLGIRYDVFTPFTEKHNQISNFDPTNTGILLGGRVIQAGVNNVPANLGIYTQYNMFQPRLGFAATVGKGLVLRGGVGTTYYPSNVTSSANLNNAPFGSALSLAGSSALPFSTPLPIPSENPATTCVAGPPICNFPTGVTTGSVSNGEVVNYRNSMIYMYNLTLEKAFGANVLSIGWVGEPGRDLYRVIPNVDIPGPPAVTGCGGPVISLPSPCQPYSQQLPHTTSIQLQESNGSSSYNAMNVIFNRRLSKGLTAAANYTWAHALANVGGPGGACGTCGILPNNFRYDWGNSNFDITNRIVLTANYEFPFGKSMTGVAGQIVKGWQVNGIYAYASGLRFTVGDGTQLMGIAGVTDRPNMISAGYASQTAQILGNGSIVIPWVAPRDFVAQSQGTPGNEEVNQFRSPNTNHFDFSLFKDFPITESVRLQFRTEVFNLTNTPNYATPGSTISAFSGGVATNAGNFGYVTATSPLYTPREIQFALKLLF